MDSSFWFDQISCRWSIVYKGVTGYNFQTKLYYSEIMYVLANSVEPDEMSHYVAFYLGL